MFYLLSYDNKAKLPTTLLENESAAGGRCSKYSNSLKGAGEEKLNFLNNVPLVFTCLRISQLLRIEATVHNLDCCLHHHPNGLLLRKRRFS
jgi:hypothetical protein